MAVAIGTNCGFVSEAPTTNPEGQFAFAAENRSIAGKFTSPANATTITEIGFWCYSNTTEVGMEAGIYTDDSENNRPSNLVGSGSGTKSTGVGWKKITGLNISVNKNTLYWIAIQVDNTSANSEYSIDSSVGNKFDYRDGGSAFPFLWGNSTDSYNNYLIAICAVYETSGQNSILILMGGAKHEHIFLSTL